MEKNLKEYIVFSATKRQIDILMFPVKALDNQIIFLLVSKLSFTKLVKSSFMGGWLSLKEV